MLKRAIIYNVIAVVVLVLSVITALSIGSSMIPLQDVWGILWHSFITGDAALYYKASEIAIVVNIRLSRIVLAICVGGGLALAGAGFQAVLRNPLADSYTLGVASGSSVGAAFIIVMQLQTLWGLWTIPVVAFISGTLTIIAVLFLSYHKGAMQLQNLILAGVIIQSFLGSFVSLMIALSEGVVNNVLFWIMGSIANKSIDLSLVVLPFLIIGITVLLRYSQALNIIALGEKEATYMGVNVPKVKLVVILACTLLTAAAVSIAGVIGFVGLVIPHMLRLIVGIDNRVLIPLSFWGGGVFLIWADTIARMVLSPRELPLGIITGLIGAPIFVLLLYKSQRHKGV